jgi:general secretion pathway protein I
VRNSVADPGRRTGGFTLIEVLVALVVVAVSMTAAILAVSERTRDGTYLREKTLAHWIALNVITERRLQAEPPSVGKTSDEVEFAGRRWRWTLVVDRTAIDTMRRLDVSVRAGDAPEESSLASVTGFYGTAIVPPGTSAVRWEVGPQAGQLPDGDGTGGDDETDAGSDDDGQVEDDGGSTDEGDADDGSDDGDEGGSEAPPEEEPPPEGLE